VNVTNIHFAELGIELKKVTGELETVKTNIFNIG
jgi:hypothetical protein